MKGETVNVNDDNFQKEVLEAELPVLVDFWAPWCGPCRMVAPVLEDLALDYAEKIKVAKLNVDENPNSSSQYGIMSIPTMLLFKNGKLVETIVGFRRKEDLSSIIDKNL
ncbi:MAG: thioredoxin [Dethiobacteria bacterium]|jgi:thioredoxin 1